MNQRRVNNEWHRLEQEIITKMATGQVTEKRERVQGRYSDLLLTPWQSYDKKGK